MQYSCKSYARSTFYWMLFWVNESTIKRNTTSTKANERDGACNNTESPLAMTADIMRDTPKRNYLYSGTVLNERIYKCKLIHSSRLHVHSMDIFLVNLQLQHQRQRLHEQYALICICAYLKGLTDIELNYAVWSPQTRCVPHSAENNNEWVERTGKCWGQISGASMAAMISWLL